MRRLLVLAVVPLALAMTAVATSAGASFTPSALAGTWKGTWKNQTYGSTGPAVIKATVSGKNLNYVSDFGGHVFGCNNPPPEKGKITPGSGANHWNAAGFVYKRKSTSLGNTTLTYKHGAKTFNGGGSDPTCLKGLTWKMAGKFSGKSFKATVHITLPGGMHATSVVNLKRS